MQSAAGPQSEGAAEQAGFASHEPSQRVELACFGAILSTPFPLPSVFVAEIRPIAGWSNRQAKAAARSVVASTRTAAALDGSPPIAASSNGRALPADRPS